MKMLLCADVGLGSPCSENLDIKLSHKWQKFRTEKLADLVDKATQENVAYVAFFGQMFGQNRVSESVIDSLFHIITEERPLNFLIFVGPAEFGRVAYRNDLPANLHLMCTDSSDIYLADDVAVRIVKGVIEMQLGDNISIRVEHHESGAYCLSDIDGQKKKILPFEPTGYDDAKVSEYGYSVLEWSENEVISYEEQEYRRFSYQTVEVKVLPEDNHRDILKKIVAAISSFKYDTFLRINLRGHSAFALMININAIKVQLQSRLFHVELFDSTIMDIDEESFDHDISLRSEFIRLALQDESVSESERNRLICYGWNVLSGGEVPAE